MIFSQQIALLTAAIGHDLNHPGFTNSYLEAIHSPYVYLYDSSPLEHHHLKYTLLILEVKHE